MINPVEGPCWALGDVGLEIWKTMHTARGVHRIALAALGALGSRRQDYMRSQNPSANVRQLTRASKTPPSELAILCPGLSNLNSISRQFRNWINRRRVAADRERTIGRMMADSLRKRKDAHTNGCRSLSDFHAYRRAILSATRAYC
jgi:hypothetical protein